jgi:hypothetical protein
MPADVEEHAHRARAVAAHQDRPAADRARDEVARRAHLALVAGIDPAAVEDPPHLALEHRGVDHRRAAHAKVELRRIVDDEGGVVHAVIIRP